MTAATTAAPAAATSLPPRANGSPAVWMTRFTLHPDRLLDECYARYGDFFRFETPLERTLCVTANPQTIKEIFRGDPKVFHAGEGNAVLGPLVGANSLLLLDEGEHLRHRKMMLPPFHGERMREYADVMRDVAERHVARWPKDRPFSTIESMQAITLEVIQRAVFGIDEADRLAHVGGLLRRILDPAANRWWMLLLMLTPSRWGPRSPWGQFRQRVREADVAIYEEIRARRADPQAAERGDVMALLLQARDEDGEPLSDREMRDELVTLLVAGHETTATSLAWTLERIVHSPHVRARLEDDPDGDYLDAVIKESLRLRPVIPAVARKLMEPVELGGYRLPAGVFVVPSIYLTQRRPDVYPDPLAFKPERFLDSPPANYEYLPFGGGVRRCLGASFAQFEMRIVLQAVLDSARLRAPDGEAERIRRRSITFAPSGGGRIVAEAA
jgi:cytochrome P450